MEEVKKSVLIVDDEESVHDFLTYNLLKANYIVYNAKNGMEGIQLAIKNTPDIILLDIMMPEMDGIITCIEMRKEQKLNSSLIVFLSARGEDYSQIAGYDAGGDDYIIKPISPKVLITKLKSMLSQKTGDRTIIEPEEKILLRGKLLINKEKYLVFFNNKQINLPRKEFELLVMLASKPEKVFTREEIFNKVWGERNGSDYRTIDVHIRKLREKLGVDYIRTQKGIGYTFVADLSINH